MLLFDVSSDMTRSEYFGIGIVLTSAAGAVGAHDDGAVDAALVAE